MNAESHRAYVVVDVVEQSPQYPTFCSHTLVCTTKGLHCPDSDIILVPNVFQSKYVNLALAGKIAIWREKRWFILSLCPFEMASTSFVLNLRLDTQ